jgi:glycosyltransferase involved in cell wall biosynthesis
VSARNAADETRVAVAGRSASCLFVLDNLGIGGSERKTIVVANGLAERGYAVHLAFLNLSHDIRCTVHPAILQEVLHRRGKVDVQAIRRLRRYILGHDIGTVWSVNLYPMLYAFFATRLLLKPPQVIGSSNITLFRNRYESLKMAAYVPIMRRLDAFVFGCRNQMELWRSRYPLGGVKTPVIYNGVDTAAFSAERCPEVRAKARGSFGLDNDSIVLAMVAQFRVEKRQEHLVEACRTLREKGHKVQVLLVGDGPTRAAVEAMVNEGGLNDVVRFAGQLDDVRPALMVADVFVLTSVAVETFSNAALEAMSMNCPVVLSDVGGAREMVVDGENGYVYPPGNVAALVERLQVLMDRQTVTLMGEKARAIVTGRFSASTMVDRYEVLISVQI